MGVIAENSCPLIGGNKPFSYWLAKEIPAFWLVKNISIDKCIAEIEKESTNWGFPINYQQSGQRSVFVISWGFLVFDKQHGCALSVLGQRSVLVITWDFLVHDKQLTRYQYSSKGQFYQL